MKSISIMSIVLTLFGTTSIAQNVGIGNNNPQYPLDLSGRMRLRGGADNNFTAGLWLGGFGADSATNKMFVGMESDSTAGFYSEQNNTGWFLVANGKNGRLGIRNRDPKYPLSFDNQGGDKISLYQDANGNYYGLGIGNSTMQLMTPHSNSSIVLGTGLSGSFTENMRIKGNGLVGIGESNPTLGGLVVNKKVGATHAVFGSNSTGVAIESGYPGIGFNNYYDGSRKAIANGFSGYIGVNPVVGGMQFLVSPASVNAGNNVALNTGMLIGADGKVGIGVTDPAYLLDIAERMRIRGTPGFSAGIWLNNEANSAIPAFIGMQADNQVGFYGSGTGWSFLMNTQTGAVSFGGNAGQPGQVLTSNGTGAAPTWQGGGSSNVFIARQSTNSASIVNGLTNIPDLVANFTLPVSSRVLFQYSANVLAQSCFACTPKRVSIILFQNLVGIISELDRADASIENDTYQTTLVSGPAVFDLPAGTYSFKVMLSCSGNTNTATAGYGKLSWQIFPN
jgi:hypothetical protein